ncbi:hypothetical protein [Campylobacter curvus]|uniref:hypothetical protein n=1 Tax=Campylobacter curvus TaxID=200 RepID=UPI000371D2D5|nr:hypothetical protein [Campylobacter curvus]QKF60971.1 putative membrane protein [Campylobacter curvus]UEB49288.1 hypothetical protein LK426_06570 [Campylobacter curvus]
MIKRVALVYLCFWLILLVAGSFISLKFLLSSQVAFFASLLILAASFRAYKKRVETRVENGRDEILAMQNIDDEWDEEEQGIKEAGVQNFSLKDEKARLKKQKLGLKDMNLTAAVMPYRLLAYAVLFLGFLMLDRKGALDIAGFLIGLAPMPLGALVFGFVSKESADNAQSVSGPGGKQLNFSQNEQTKSTRSKFQILASNPAIQGHADVK